jgi:hypothetical protein
MGNKAMEDPATIAWHKWRRGEDAFTLTPVNAFHAGYRAAQDSRHPEAQEVDVVCGQGIQFGNFLVGCGQPINSRDTYRCYECDNAFHKHCLKQHCTERKHGVKE